MALTDTFVRNAKTTKPAGQKHADGGGLYLLVTPAGKYWRMDYRYLGKRKTLALGIYPEVALAKARIRCAEARRLLANDIDPSQARREEKQDQIFAATQTFELVARLWLQKTAANRAETTRVKVTGWLEKDVFPYLGKSAVSTLKPRDILVCVQRMEARGVFESAHRVRQICGQVLRFAVATGLAERDVTADLKGALSVPVRGNYAAIVDPKPAGALMRAINGYEGHPFAAAALKLSAMVFVRPGELRSAEWREIDLDDAMWQIPGVKMKMRRDHLVPLATQAVEILRALQPMSGHGKYVFPSIRSDERCMSEQAEGELVHARRETIAERDAAAKARVDLAKSVLRLEAMPRLEADLQAVRDELRRERQERTDATQLAAVLEAKLEAARERAAQSEAIAAEARAALANRETARRETGRGNGGERRTPP